MYIYLRMQQQRLQRRPQQQRRRQLLRKQLRRCWRRSLLLPRRRRRNWQLLQPMPQRWNLQCAQYFQSCYRHINKTRTGKRCVQSLQQPLYVSHQKYFIHAGVVQRAHLLLPPPHLLRLLRLRLRWRRQQLQLLRLRLRKMGSLQTGSRAPLGH
jgi:hypothetical protein